MNQEQYNELVTQIKTILKERHPLLVDVLVHMPFYNFTRALNYGRSVSVYGIDLENNKLRAVESDQETSYIDLDDLTPPGLKNIEKNLKDKIKYLTDTDSERVEEDLMYWSQEQYIDTPFKEGYEPQYYFGDDDEGITEVWH